MTNSKESSDAKVQSPQPPGAGQASEQSTESQRKGGKDSAGRDAKKEFEDTAQQDGE